MSIDVYDESRLQVSQRLCVACVSIGVMWMQVQADIQEEEAAAAAELAAARAKARDLEQQVLQWLHCRTHPLLHPQAAAADMLRVTCVA